MGARATWLNTRTAARIVVTDALDGWLRGAPGAEAPPAEHLRGLAELGFVVAAGHDEAADVLAAFDMARNDDEVHLTVAPTLACNLRCDYCFEAGHPNRRMDGDDIAAVGTWVRDQLATAHRLSVTWFGGEPLLHLGGIRRLSRVFLTAATFRGASYAASIVTNGTHLSAEVAAELRRWRVLEAQVSLDGARRHHDLSRVGPAARPTYDTVVAGISAGLAHLDVIVRVQVDRRNAAGIGDLIDDLADRGLNRAQLAFARLEPPSVYRAGATHDCGRWMTVAEFAAAEVGWLEHAAARGFRPLPFGPPGALPCGAVHRRHLAVGPGALAHRCWAQLGDESTAVGTITPGGAALDDGADRRWRTYLPGDDGCSSCNFLPLCLGGCPLARVGGAMADAGPVAREEFKERYVCSPRKHNLADLVAKGLA